MSGVPLLVFADDWGRHPSSCQHLVCHLLDEHSVVWVNTIGTRTPKFDLATVTRAVEKLRHWSRRPAAGPALPPQLRVCNPRMWPSFASRFGRGLNRRLLTRQLGRVLADLPQRPIAVTTLPIVADLIGVLPVRRWVYYCVDDFGQWPGLDQTTLARLEAELVRKADVLVAVSENLRERLAGLGRTSHLLTHGVDLNFWHDGTAVPSGLENRERPLVVFWGVVDRRMDTAFVRRLAERLDRGTVLLVGPEQDPDPELTTLPRVLRLPAQPMDVLPGLARAAAVLVMPYADLPVTRAMQPLKLKEYLATGRPTVVRRLPATAEWGDCLDLAATPEEFAEAVRRRLDGVLPVAQATARAARLGGEGWQEKARQLERWCLEEASCRS